MERFVLQPAHFRGGRLVPLRDESPIEVEWPQLVALVGGQSRRTELITLRRLAPGDFVGVRNREDGPANFYLSNRDRSGKVEWLLKKDPTLFDSVERVYRVEKVQYDSRVLEAS